MRLLFVHQNFPGQFRHLAPALVQQGHQITALAWGTGEPEQWQGVSCHRYSASRGSTAAIHPWVADFETKVIRGEACLRAARRLAEAGYCPDAIIAHPGWGESLFLLDLWPGVPLGLYSEFFYSEAGADVGFDPDFAPADSLLDACRVKLKTSTTCCSSRLPPRASAPPTGRPPVFLSRFAAASASSTTASTPTGCSPIPSQPWSCAPPLAPACGSPATSR